MLRKSVSTGVDLLEASKLPLLVFGRDLKVDRSMR